MSLVLLTSIAICLVAFVYSLFLIRRVRDWRLGFLAIMLALMATRQSLSLYNHFDGYYISYSANLTDLFGLLVSVVAFLAVQACLRVVGDLRQGHEALTENEALYRAVVQDQTELVCRFLPDATLTFVNDAYCRYFGRSREELVGQKFMLMIPEEDHSKVQEYFASLGPENPVATHERRVSGPDGDIRWHRWTNRVIFDEEGNVIEIQGTGRDITEPVFPFDKFLVVS